jgi:hypothetical protein
MTAPLTYEQIQRGKNLDPASRTSRAKKGAAKSPWSKGPTVNTTRAHAEFQARPRFNERLPK